MATLSVQSFSPETGVLAVGDPISVSFVRNDQSADTIVVRLYYSAGAFIFDATQYATLTDTTCVLTVPWSALVSESGGWVRAGVGFWFEMVAYETLPASYANYEWTRVVRVNTYAPPEIGSLTPSGSISGYPIDIQWTVDPGGMDGVLRSQSLAITDAADGRMVYAAAPGTGIRSLTLSVGDVLLESGHTYYFRLGVTNDVGFADYVIRTVQAGWSPPPVPTATVTVDDDTLGATVTVTAGAHPASQVLTVARIGADGSRWVVGTGLTSGAQVLDPLPPLGVEYAYEVSVVDSNGAANSATVLKTIHSSYWMLDFGDGATEHVALMGNPKVSRSLKHGGESYHFADGGAGGGLPVWYGTTDRDVSGGWTFDDVGPETADELFSLCDRHPVCWMRDPFGRRRRAHVEPKESHGTGQLWQLSLDWDEVRFEEAW